MERRNCNFEIKKYLQKLENRYYKLFITWQNTFAEEKSKPQTKKLKSKDNIYRKQT